MSVPAEPTGTLEVALAHTERLLRHDPALALEQAGEILKVVPGHPMAVLVTGVAQRSLGDLPTALQTLRALAGSQPRSALTHFEYGQTLSEAGQYAEAIAAFRHALALRPDLPDAWRSLGDALIGAGDTAGADAAYANHIRASTRNPQLLEAASALVENRIPEADQLLRTYLKGHPTDVAALRMLAEVGARLGHYGDAEKLLLRCLELAPSFNEARHNYAIVLHRLNKQPEALEQVDQLLAKDPNNGAYRNLKAVVLNKVGEFAESLELFAAVLKANPKHARIWMSYGHTLSTAGREADSIEAYHRCIELLPQCGEAWWSLANLKTYRFGEAEIAAMREQLARDDLGAEDRFHLHFALGTALEALRQYESAFEHYAQGNRLRREQISYSAADTSALVGRAKALFTPQFLAERAGYGAYAADPIFIVGLPRSGSTLVEQILASHSRVEGTMELPNIIAMVSRLIGRPAKDPGTRYATALAELTAERCRELGEQYLEETRIQRKLDRPFFIDKMPNNFLHTGFIHLILPHAKVIDARRHPMACGFSLYKQHFARGQNFSYSLEDIGRYYRDYVELMAHFDAVLPGRVYRVIHEELLADTESQVRSLLAHCGLEFEESCLRFYENERAVRTASANQVRRPISRSGVDQWRHFEPWLAPLRDALGNVLETYPRIPRF
jgi:tetratricopeptide (TPR) repeat protein